MENKAKIEDPCGNKPEGLHLSRQEMLDLASNVTEILVDRIKALPAEDCMGLVSSDKSLMIY